MINFVYGFVKHACIASDHAVKNAQKYAKWETIAAEVPSDMNGTQPWEKFESPKKKAKIRGRRTSDLKRREARRC